MLCSWWRYFATAVGVAALSGSLAVASMAQTSQDKTQWSFLGLGYETTPSVNVSMGSPNLDSGFFSADAFVSDECPIPSFVTPDQSGDLRLDPIQALEMPVDAELESFELSESSISSIDEDPSLIDEFAPMAFPNNGCDYGCPSLPMTANDSRVANSEENPVDSANLQIPAPLIRHSIEMPPIALPNLKMDLPNPLNARLLSMLDEAGRRLAHSFYWDHQPVDSGEPGDYETLISGPVPPAVLEPNWPNFDDASHLIELDPNEIQRSHSESNVPEFDTPPEIQPVLPENQLETPEDSSDAIEDSAAEKKSLNELFDADSAQEISIQSPSPAGMMPPSNPAIRIPASGQRQINIIFQFNHFNQSSTIERQSSNDRIVGSGIALPGHVAKNESVINEAEIFDPVEDDDEYWNHYRSLSEWISLPLVENIKQDAPARNASHAHQIIQPAPITLDDLKQIPGIAKSWYASIFRSAFFSDTEYWVSETLYAIETELCGMDLLHVWNFVRDEIEAGQERLKRLEEIEARQREAERLRYIASRIQHFSDMLDDGARKLNFMALQKEGASSAKKPTKIESR